MTDFTIETRTGIPVVVWSDGSCHPANAVEIAQDAEIKALKEWKRSTLEVEASWDCQAVAKAIGVPLGEDIRRHILPYILKWKAEVEAFEKARGMLVSLTIKDCAAFKSRAEALEQVVEKVRGVVAEHDMDLEICGDRMLDELKAIIHK